MSQLLESNPIPIPPQLIGRLKQALGRSGTGFDEGTFLQQLHYWLQNSETTGWIRDGIKWIYNSLESWQQQFPWMTQYALRKAIANLQKLGLIQTAQHWISTYNRVMFYRIDYERLQTFAEDVCFSITPRCANWDHVDVRSDHTSDTETTSEITFKEQQTAVVVSNLEEQADLTNEPLSTISRDLMTEPKNPGDDRKPTASSGKSSKLESSHFPELEAAVAQAIAHPPNQPLPTSLKRAIAQFPDRVQPAIEYLRKQQQTHLINNPIGYLYRLISEEWEITTASPSSPAPIDFSQWFDWAKAQGWVIAATMINGIHQTLHVEQGWVPTEQLMKATSTLLSDRSIIGASIWQT